MNLTKTKANQSSAFDSYKFNENLNSVRGIFIQQDERVGQAKSYKKIDQSLQGFLETEFMKKFKNFRLEVESLMSTFKAHQNSFKPAEVAKVKKAYAKFSDKFNMNVLDIKRDFVDGKKLKFIRKYPDMYAASLELKLRDLADDYSQNLERSIAELTGSDEYSAVPLLAILSVVQFGVEFTNYLTRMRYDARRVKEEHLDQYFVEPFKLKRWEEIEMVGGDIYNQFQNNNSFNDPMQMDQPIENENIEDIGPF